MTDEIQQCLEVLKQGGTIIYPTDTLWGLGCDATDEKAVEKVIALKGRKKDQSLIILVDDQNKLDRYVKEVPEIAWDLLDQVDTPLTIVYPAGKNLASNVLASDGSIAIRVTTDPFCKELIRKFGKPIVSTSANYTGDMPPISFSRINLKLIESVDYVVNWQRNRLHSTKPSSIIKLGLKGEIELIRQ
ncbi:MAG: L-threonylcarbamoyladenylate synthase [Bacteroidetes bacterium]|nr:L-threonylcarbamoyladenylate synthase [Bacteroidota bacterium]